MKREVDLPPYVMPVILVLLLIGIGIYWIQSPPAQSTEEAVWIPRACGPIFAKVGGPKMNSYTFTQTVNFLVRTEKTGKGACTPEQAQRLLGLLMEYALAEGQAREDLKYQVTQALTNDQLVELAMLVDVPDDPGCGPG